MTDSLSELMANPLIQSIEEVALVVERAPKEEVKSIPVAALSPTRTQVGSETLVHSIACVSRVVLANMSEIPVMTFTRPAYLPVLGVSRDEEVYSNLVASVFNPALGGPVALDLLSRIASMFQVCKLNSTGPIHVYRERRLGSLRGRAHLNSEIVNRRIDILVEHPELVLIIENKIDTLESENQTRDYFGAVSSAYSNCSGLSVLGVLLSPDGRAADCSHFRSLSYSLLYRLLSESVQAFEQARDEYPLPWFTCEEIYATFVMPKKAVANRIKKFWEERSA